MQITAPHGAGGEEGDTYLPGTRGSGLGKKSGSWFDGRLPLPAPLPE